MNATTNLNLVWFFLKSIQVEGYTIKTAVRWKENFLNQYLKIYQRKNDRFVDCRALAKRIICWNALSVFPQNRCKDNGWLWYYDGDDYDGGDYDEDDDNDDGDDYDDRNGNNDVYNDNNDDDSDDYNDENDGDDDYHDDYYDDYHDDNDDGDSDDYNDENDGDDYDYNDENDGDDDYYYDYHDDGDDLWWSWWWRWSIRTWIIPFVRSISSATKYRYKMTSLPL